MAKHQHAGTIQHMTYHPLTIQRARQILHDLREDLPTNSTPAQIADAATKDAALTLATANATTSPQLATIIRRVAKDLQCAAHLATLDAKQADFENNWLGQLTMHDAARYATDRDFFDDWIAATGDLQALDNLLNDWFFFAAGVPAAKGL
jgi:MarR-like DNA-binding transcriptional regulator SgrR of sgrS sRNA